MLISYSLESNIPIPNSLELEILMLDLLLSEMSMLDLSHQASPANARLVPPSMACYCISNLRLLEVNGSPSLTCYCISYSRLPEVS